MINDIAAAFVLVAAAGKPNLLSHFAAASPLMYIVSGLYFFRLL